MIVLQYVQRDTITTVKKGNAFFIVVIVLMLLKSTKNVVHVVKRKHVTIQIQKARYVQKFVMLVAFVEKDC